MRKIYLFCVIVTVILGLCILSSYAGDKPGDRLAEVFKKDVKPKLSLIPVGVKIAKDFKPGKGKAIGSVNAIKGTVLTIHRDEKTAYILKKGNKLYIGDTLISEEQSKAQAKLNDGSFITLGPYTKIVFDKSVYDPSKPTRNSLLSLLFGKARFIVTKLTSLRDSRFKVKTPTAVAGVRGSDFAICVAPGSPLTTTIMTGEGTTVTFAGNTGPTQLVGPMSASSATQGMVATAPLPISSYLTTPFVFGGLSEIHYLYYIAGGVAGGAAVFWGGSDSDSGGSGSSGPVVTDVDPDEGSSIPAAETIEFDFSKNMTQAGITVSNFVIMPAEEWTVDSLNWPNNQTVRVDISPTTTPSGFTITLVDFTDTEGNPLEGQTSFVYN